MGMPFREPTPNPTLSLTEKIKPALIGYRAKIANQIGKSVSSTTISLKNGERLSHRTGVLGFIANPACPALLSFICPSPCIQEG